MALSSGSPALGESVVEAAVGQWHKQVGEAVSADEPLVELETDKVTVEVPAPASGALSKISLKEGDSVGVGEVLGGIAAGAGRPGDRGHGRDRLLRSPPRRCQRRSPSSPSARAGVRSGGQGAEASLRREEASRGLSPSPAARKLDPRQDRSPTPSPAQAGAARCSSRTCWE